jgi:hypothetical protein
MRSFEPIADNVAPPLVVVSLVGEKSKILKFLVSCNSYLSRMFPFDSYIPCQSEFFTLTGYINERPRAVLGR